MKNLKKHSLRQNKNVKTFVTESVSFKNKSIKLLKLKNKAKNQRSPKLARVEQTQALLKSIKKNRKKTMKDMKN